MGEGSERDVAYSSFTLKPLRLGEGGVARGVVGEWAPVTAGGVMQYHSMQILYYHHTHMHTRTHTHTPLT